jgi:protein-S-isoprenylcysteine O-methyltransferase Ste14
MHVRNLRIFHLPDGKLGWTLVTVQGILFLCVAAGALATGIGPRLPHSTVAGWVLVGVGAVGLVVAGRHLGDALAVNPVPNHTGMVAQGAYRWVRHPIYTCVLVICLGVAIAAGTVLAYVAVAALALFLGTKTAVEERMLVATYPGYAEYAARTGKFIPGIAALRHPARRVVLPRSRRNLDA